MPLPNNKSLTATGCGFMMAPLSQNVKVGLSLPDKTGHKRPLNTVVFLCPPKTQAALCRVYSVMAGCIEQLLIELAGACTGSENLIHSATQRVSPMGGGYPLYTGATAMNTPQNHSAEHPATATASGENDFQPNPHRQHLPELERRYRAVKGSFEMLTVFASPNAKSAAAMVEDAECLLEAAKKLQASFLAIEGGQ